MVDPLAVALPSFVGIAAAEALVVARRPGGRFRFDDLASGIGCGMLDQIVNVSVTAAFLVLYALTQRRFALLAIADRSALAWLACVVAHDLAYYAFHRASHRVNALWACHAVHHQGEHYALSMSLRQGTFATWVSFAFYLPLALLGFPVEMFVVVHAAYQLYQFCVHTRLVPALGPLERLLATPFLHRVHHGREAAFHDRNYGGFFIVWDRLFGTFAPCDREPSYGVTSGLASYSPYWANLAPLAELFRRSRHAPSLWQAAQVWLRPPEWQPPWDAPRAPACAPDVALSRGAAAYAGLLLVSTLLLAGRLLWPGAGWVAPWRAASVAWVLSALVTLPAFLDGRAWAARAEAARLALFVAAALLQSGFHDALRHG